MTQEKRKEKIINIVLLLITTVMFCGCCVLRSSQLDRCSSKETASWHYPKSWLVERMSVAEADRVIESDIGIPIEAAARDSLSDALEWIRIKKEFSNSAEIWRVESPPNALGPTGIAIIEDCKMIDWVTTLES